MSVKTPTVTFAGGATESSVLDTGDYLLSGFKLPAGWTTADITFTASESEAGTYVGVHDTSGSRVTITAAAASRWYAIAPQDFAGVPYVKLVSSVAQASAVDVVVALRRSE